MIKMRCSMKKLLVMLLMVSVSCTVVFAQAADCPASLSSSTSFSCPLRVAFDKATMAPTDTVGFSVSGWDFVWPDVYYYTGADWVLAKSLSTGATVSLSGTAISGSRYINAQSSPATLSGVKAFARTDTSVTDNPPVRGTFAFYACNRVAGSDTFDCNDGKWMVKSVTVCTSQCATLGTTCSGGQVSACVASAIQGCNLLTTSAC